MACFETEKSIIRSMLEDIVNDQPARMNGLAQDIEGTRDGKDLYDKARIYIGA